MDCMEYMKTCKDNEFDLAIVDPPYGISVNKSGRLGHYGGKGKKWDKETPNQDYFTELFRVSKNQVIWGGNYFVLPPCKCFLIWDKSQPESVSFAMAEFAWASFNSSAKTYYQRPQNMDEQRIHPTQKPIKLYQWILDKYAKPTDKILDTHLGSASSAIAAHYFGCDFTGLELDKDYFDESQKRFKDATAQTDMFGMN